jgi:tetratricopeptide (TPR) repeat protein
MAGNRQEFDKIMAQAQTYATAEDWQAALREYIKAAKEIPNELNARLKLAIAFYKTNRFDQAFPQLQALVKIRPKDPEALRYLAETLIKLGRNQEAVDTFYKLRDLAIELGQEITRIEALSDIIGLNPDNVDAYLEIIATYQNMGDNASAAAVALELSRYYISQGRNDNALRTVEDALEIAPDNQDLIALKGQLETGTIIDLPDLPDLHLEDELPALPDFPDAEDVGATTPTGHSQNQGATYEPPQASGSYSNTVNQIIMEAERALEAGESGRALRQYELAIEAGADGSDLFYSIGQLYAQENQLDQASEYLYRAAQDPDYAASALYALAQVYEQQGDIAKAGDTYDNALMMIDLQQIGENEVDELIDMYETAASVFLHQENTDKAADLYTRLSGYLQSQGFNTPKSGLVLVKAHELRENVLKSKTAAATASSESRAGQPFIRFGGGTDGVPIYSDGLDDGENISTDLSDVLSPNGNGRHGFNGMTDLTADPSRLSSDQGLDFLAKPTITPPPSTQLAVEAVFPSQIVRIEQNVLAMPYIRAAEDFLRRGLASAAIDACHETIRFFPDYLPAQFILAEVFIQRGWYDIAKTKYQFLVDIYQIRSEPLKAVEAFKRLVLLSPDNTGLRSKLANLMLQNGLQEQAAEIMLSNVDSFLRSNQMESALAECKKLRTLAPNSAPIRVQYGDLLLQNNEYPEALGEFRKAIELDSNNLKAICLLNVTLLISGEGSTDARWGSFKAVLERTREDAKTLQTVNDTYRIAFYQHSHAGLAYALGCLYLEARHFPIAMRLFEETVKLATANSMQYTYELLARWELAQGYSELGKIEEMVSELGKVVNLTESAHPADYGHLSLRYGSLPDQSIIYRKLATAFSKQGQKDYALKALKRVKQFKPYDREVYFELAELHFDQGQLNEALAELGELTTYYEQKGDVEAVIEVLKEMIRLAPNKIEVRDKLAQVYLKSGKTEEGLAQLEELAELQDRSSRKKDAVRTFQREAELYWTLGNREKAYNLYDRIVQISPNDIEARQQLVNLHILAGRFKDAADEQRAIAEICMRTGQTQEAIAALHQVIQLALDDTRAYYQLASVLSSIGEYGQSYKLYSRILRLEPENDKAKALQAQARQKAIQAGQLQEKKKE